MHGNALSPESASSDGVLLTSPDYYGTLAAARCYGRAGIAVHLADGAGITQTGWSRYVKSKLKAPAPTDVARFGDWLIETGKKRPGMFLYATSDDLAWILASRRDELSRYYSMYQPPLATIVSLLDKRRLAASCAELGLDVPATVYIESEAELEQAAQNATFPIVIKPRTQMLLRGQNKGKIVHSRAELLTEYRRIRREGTYDRELLAYDHTISWPMLQRYHAETRADTYSISGFIDRSGEVFELRAAQKLFQRPRTIGVGLCFISQPVEPQLRDKIHALCRKSGYYGAFEVEFIRAAGKHLLIDFNPRFYGQLGFEIARGMPLPLYVYYAARSLTGEALRAAAAGDQGHSEDKQYVYANRWLLRTVMGAQSLSGRLRANERRLLRGALEHSAAGYADAILDGADRGPLAADLLIFLRYVARHPRDFVFKFFLDR